MKLERKHIFILLFLAATAFFLYQHSTGLSWDFSVYSMNAKSAIADGVYSEIERAPLASVLIGSFSSFGWIAAEYLYIIFVSTLFAFAAWKLSKSLNFDSLLFYVILLSPFVLSVGLSVGTELLALSLLMLFVAYLFTYKVGIIAGLLVLCRYTSLPLTSLLLFNFWKGWRNGTKKILVGGMLFAAIMLPWLAFNWYLKGDPFSSIGNSYALNVFFRSGAEITSPSFFHFLDAGLYLLPLAIIGLYFMFKRKLIKYDWIMLSVSAFIIYSYLTTPWKEARYLFLLILPLAYFSYLTLEKIKRRRYVVLALVLASFLILAYSFNSGGLILYNDRPILEANSALDKCEAYSDSWPYFNYLGRPTHPVPYYKEFESIINSGGRIILFEPLYDASKEELARFPVFYNSSRFVIYGDENKCLTPSEKVDETYLDRLNKRTNETYYACDFILPKEVCNIWRN